MTERRAIQFFVALIVVCGVAIMLTSCGSDDDAPAHEGPKEITNDDQKVYDIAGWTTETDPLTGYEYRCLTAWRKDGGGSLDSTPAVAGMTMFCTPLIKQ